MMRFFLFLWLNIILLSAYCQNNKSYIKYHQSCRAAEKFFIDGDSINCINLYEQIFKEYDFLFPRDCFIAAQIAYKSSMDSIAVEFLIKAVPFGLRQDFFSKPDAYNNPYKINQLRKSKYWDRFLSIYDSLRNIYTERVDWKLKEELIEMVKIDQDWRIKNNKWFNRNFRRGLENGFNKVNIAHMAYLDSVFQNVGYPGVWLTGVGDFLAPEETNYAVLNNQNLTEIFSVILYHYDSAYVKYGEFLKAEIDKGHIHPRTFALIRDFRDRFLVKRDKNEEMYYNIMWYRKNYTIEEFEQHCNEIGCPTWKHQYSLANKLGKGYDSFLLPLR